MVEMWNILLKFTNNLGDVVRKADKVLYDHWEEKSL